MLTREELEQSQLYSEALDIDLAAGGDEAAFAWFLVSQLYGGRIAESIAERTYWVYAGERLLSPAALIAAGREHLINPVMRRGGYVRYDNRKVDQILRACHTLIDEYGGRVSALHEAAADAADLEARLKAIYGIGPVTANIFLRELRPFWQKADPAPLPVVADLARVLGIDLAGYDRKSLRFCRLEAAYSAIAGNSSGASRRQPAAAAGRRRPYGFRASSRLCHDRVQRGRKRTQGRMRP